MLDYEVPGAGQKTKLSKDNLHTPSDAMALKEVVDLVGSGRLDVEHAWVQPFNIGAQQSPPAATDFKLNYAPLVFAGEPTSTVVGGVPQQIIKQVPAALAQKFGVSPVISISVKDNNGTQMLSVGNVRLGVDYVVGSVNAGDFSQPLTQQHLPQLESALKLSLALVAAAYDQGKEPGDLVYDRAMSSAKTILYALDKFAAANPTLAAEAKAAAVAGVPADFPFELFSGDRVPPDAQTRPLADVTSGKRSSTMSLIEARQAALGRVDTKLSVNQGTLNAPRVDQAAIMKGGQHNTQSAAVVRGRGTPGEIVQVFFGNCLAGDQRADFDDSGGVSGGDPVLVDDDFGRGPEVLRLPLAFAGDRMVVGVFSQPPSTHPTVSARVELFHRGQSRGAFSETLAPNTFWNVAFVDVDDIGIDVDVDVSASAAGGVCPTGSWICTAPANACSD